MSGAWYGKPQSAYNAWSCCGQYGQLPKETTCVDGPRQAHVPSGQAQITSYLVLPHTLAKSLSHLDELMSDGFNDVRGVHGSAPMPLTPPAMPIHAVAPSSGAGAS